ncbi:MAG: potassium channel family protein [Pseudomonadota bacterium]
MPQLLVQIIAGGVLITCSTAVQVLTIAAMMAMSHRLSRLMANVGRMRATFVIAAGGLWVIFGQLLGVWVWAVAFLILNAFADLETSLYFSLSAYTTLGFGDVLPHQDWRILGALVGANGMLGFGLATAALVEFIGRIRSWTE